MKQSHAVADSVLRRVVDGYLECAAWADAPEGSTAEFAPGERDKAVEVCRAYISACGNLFEQAIDQAGYSPERFGHDFWLSRCGHGANFQDRDELRTAVEGDYPVALDRSGLSYGVSGTLAKALFQVAYGTDGAISRFAYPSLSEDDGLLYIE